MLDQFGNDVGPGYIGSNGDTVQSLSLAAGGDGSGSWSDPGVQAQYNQTQQDLQAIRDLMATQGAGYMVTGNASLSNGGDTTAYLPGLMQQAGITPTAGILSGYQNVTGQAYQPGSQTQYNPATGRYEITGGSQAPVSTGGMQQPNTSGVVPSGGVVAGLFGGGAATANRPAEQLATIKGTWNQYLNGQMSVDQIKQAMTQYGVNYADIAAVTGQSAEQIRAMLEGRPQGTIHSPSGGVSNVGVQPNDDYMTQLNKYYGAYFQGAQPETTMLNSWYNTPYTPPVTGYQKPTTTAGAGTSGTAAGTAPNQLTNERSGGNTTTTGGMSTTGVGRVTDAIKAEAADTFKKYLGLGIAPAAAITLTKNYLAEKGFMDAVNATDDPLGSWLKAQYDFGPPEDLGVDRTFNINPGYGVTGSGGLGPGYGGGIGQSGGNAAGMGSYQG
jgi:hypothetical protein